MLLFTPPTRRRLAEKVAKLMSFRRVGRRCELSRPSIVGRNLKNSVNKTASKDLCLSAPSSTFYLPYFLRIVDSICTPVATKLDRTGYCIRDLDSERLESTGWLLVGPIFPIFPCCIYCCFALSNKTCFLKRIEIIAAQH